MAYKKYYIYKQKVSYDGGINWEYTGTQIPSGDSIGTYATLEDCEAAPILQYDWVLNGTMCDYCEASDAPKLINTIPTGETTTAITTYCDGSTTITTSDIDSVRTSLLSSYIGSCITAIGNNAYSGCTSLNFTRIPSTVTSIGDNAFNNCNVMTECSIPYGVVSIGNSAFTNCTSLSYIDLPDSLISLGTYAFSNCHNFRYMAMPNSLVSIQAHTFDNCDGLSDIELPGTISSIGDSAFANCDGLYSLIIQSVTPPTLGSNVFQNTGSNLKIYVPAGSVNAYKSASGWSSYSDKIYSIEQYNNG